MKNRSYEVVRARSNSLSLRSARSNSLSLRSARSNSLSLRSARSNSLSLTSARSNSLSLTSAHSHRQQLTLTPQWERVRDSLVSPLSERIVLLNGSASTPERSFFIRSLVEQEQRQYFCIFGVPSVKDLRRECWGALLRGWTGEYLILVCLSDQIGCGTCETLNCFLTGPRAAGKVLLISPKSARLHICAQSCPDVLWSTIDL